METNNLLRKQAYYAKWFQPMAATPAPEEPCRFWAAGECTRGNSCRFSHSGPGAASKRSKSEGRTGQGNRRDEVADRATPVETHSLPNDSPKGKGKYKASFGSELPKAGSGLGGKGTGRDRSSTPGPRRSQKLCCYFQDGSCQKGDQCIYQHIKATDPEEKMRLKKMREEGKARAESQSRSQTPQPGKRHCIHWENGRCDYGDKCNFVHDDARKGINADKPKDVKTVKGKGSGKNSSKKGQKTGTPRESSGDSGSSSTIAR